MEQRFVVTADSKHLLPAGRYRLTASRGGEYTIAAADVALPKGGEARFDAAIERVVDTRGYVAADFHLHTELSTDSAHPLEDAVRQMAAEGLEVLASTDHEHISDLDAVVARTDAKGFVVMVPGEEVSTTTFGHINGYPLKRNPARAGGGAVPWFGLSPSAIFSSLRSRGDDVVVQVNHPNLGRSSFFQAIGLDPATAKVSGDPEALGLPAGTDLADLSFEAIEVWNGYTRGGNEQTFSDFLALRWAALGPGNAARRWIMVGNSDSHRPALPPGAPRTYLRVPDDARGHYSWNDARAGLRGGDATVSAGLFVEASIGKVRPGGVVQSVSGKVTLRVRVQAPPWVDCTRLRIYSGVATLIDRPIKTPRNQVVRFDEDLVVDTEASTFLVARADGDADAALVFPWKPFGVTNPLEVEGSGGTK
ncbi:MAG: hypothetical protein EXR72_24640 [Myxococcales bacterium]|nr:hypothetical protein [Myxococcales bacterium]